VLRQAIERLMFRHRLRHARTVAREAKFILDAVREAKKRGTSCVLVTGPVSPPVEAVLKRFMERASASTPAIS
jgi:hypothetical protein